MGADVRIVLFAETGLRPVLLPARRGLPGTAPGARGTGGKQEAGRLMKSGHTVCPRPEAHRVAQRIAGGDTPLAGARRDSDIAWPPLPFVGYCRPRFINYGIQRKLSATDNQSRTGLPCAVLQ